VVLPARPLLLLLLLSCLPRPLLLLFWPAEYQQPLAEQDAVAGSGQLSEASLKPAMLYYRLRGGFVPVK